MTGGGRTSADPGPLASEATAILRAALADFRAWGRLPVVATWDDRRPAPPLAADEVVPVSPTSYSRALVRIARRCGAALVLAPETDGQLERTTGLLEDAGVLVVGSPSWAVAAAADKASYPARLAAVGVPCPATVLTVPGRAADDALRVGYPLVAKPCLGAGCERVMLVDGEDGLAGALEAFERSGARRWLLQEYVLGEAVSVSLLVSDDGALPLGVNTQDVRPGTPFEYRGGVAGVTHTRGVEIVAVARAAVAAFPGLRGYVGVDLVVTPERCVVIEVNPRLTTSYLGLRLTLSENLAAMVWRAAVEGSLPRSVSTEGPAPFSRSRGDD